MEVSMGDSENNKLNEFELGSELSTLIAKDEIPAKIAQKLEQKLKEKHVAITKQQLYTLVNKIKEILRSYSKIDHKVEKEPLQKTEKLLPVTNNENMQKLVETLDNLQERITSLEKGVMVKGEKPPKMVTTSDVKVPGNISVPMHDISMEPLTEIPNDPENIIVLMKWLQYLIDKCGRSYLPTILDYYVDIGWISEEAKISLIDYSHGIADEGKKTIDTVRKSVSDLPARDHIQSLLFIQKLKGREFDKHFLERIDGEINRITKKIDAYRINIG